MDLILKQITDAGIGLGSLILLTYIIVNQNKIIQNFNKNIEENTAVTRALAEKIQQSIEHERQTREAINKCRYEKRQAFSSIK